MSPHEISDANERLAQPAGVRRLGLPDDGPVRGRPAGHPARHHRPAAPVRDRRRQRVRPDPDRRAGQPVRRAASDDAAAARRRCRPDPRRPARPPAALRDAARRPARSRAPRSAPARSRPGHRPAAPAARGRPSGPARPARARGVRRRCHGAPRPRPPVATAPPPVGARRCRPDNSLPVNGAMPANGAPAGRPVLPAGGNGPGRPGGRSRPATSRRGPPLPMRSAPRAGSARGRSRRSAPRPAGRCLRAVRSTSPTRSRTAPRSGRRSSSSCSRSGSGSGRRPTAGGPTGPPGTPEQCARPRPRSSRRPAPPAADRGSLGVPGRRGLAGGRAAAAADQRRHHPGRAARCGCRRPTSCPAAPTSPRPRRPSRSARRTGPPRRCAAGWRATTRESAAAGTPTGGRKPATTARNPSELVQQSQEQS